jgi:hypothetical protein
MFLNSMRIRLGMIATGIILSGAYFMCGGMNGSKNTSIQIEFGMYPNEFLGSQVEIDGQPAGELKKFGNALRTGFLVKEGEHEVAIVHPKLDSEICTVETEKGRPVVLILDIAEQYNAEDGTSEAMIVFQR